MFKKIGFRINELYSQMGFYFQMKKSMGILETNDWKIEYVARFFYYESYKGLVVKWKRHNGGLVLKKSYIHF